MTATYALTYEYVTPESAEDGDASERGFLGIDTPLDPVDQDDIPTWAVDAAPLDMAESAASLPEAYAALCIIAERYAWEPSCHPWTEGEAWFTSVGDTDYRTGAERRVSVHFDGLSPVQWRCLAALFAECKRRGYRV